MKRFLIISAAALFMAGCQTGPKITPVDIQPVTKVKSDPFDAAEVKKQAKEDLKSERYQDALNNYAKLVAFDPEDDESHIGRGQALLALGSHEKAAEVFWDEERWGDTPKDEVKLGQILSGIYTDQYDIPEWALEHGLAIAPKDPRLWNAKGRLHDQKREWMVALTSYVSALESNRWTSGTVNNMGMSLLLQGRYKEARVKFKQAKKLSPKTTLYDNNYRMSLLLSGKFKKALDGVPDERAADLMNDAGYIAQTEDRPALAKMLFKRAIDVSPVHHVKATHNLESLTPPS